MVSLASDISKKRPAENVFVPKYRPRKVIAYREFPVGCGSNAAPQTLKSGRDGSSGANGIKQLSGFGSSEVKPVGADVVGTSMMVNVLESEVPRNSEKAVVMEVDAPVTVGVINPVTLVEANKIDDVGSSGGTGSSDAVESRLYEAHHCNTPLFVNKAEFNRNGTVNNPVEVDRAESLDAVAGEVKKILMDGCADHPLELITENKLVEVGTLKGHEISSAVQFPRLKDKFRHRKVSAIRHFPPHCGSNASVALEVKSKDPPGKVSIAIGSADCTRSLNIDNSVDTKAIKDEYSSITVSKGSVSRSFEGIKGPKGKGAVVFSAGKEVPSTRNNGLPGEVVHGLMAEPYCPWRKGKLTSKYSNGGTRRVKQPQQDVPLQHKSRSTAMNSDVKVDTTACSDYSRAEEAHNYVPVNGDDNPGGHNGAALDIVPISVYQPESDNNDEDCARTALNNAVYSPREIEEMRSDDIDREIVQNLKGKDMSNKSDGRMSQEKEMGTNKFWGLNTKPCAKKSVPKPKNSRLPKHMQVLTSKNTSTSRALVLSDNQSRDFDQDTCNSSLSCRNPKYFEVSLRPFGTNASGHGDARNSVRETLRLFHTILRKLVHAEEANFFPDHGNSGQPGKKRRRIDLEAVAVIKKMGKEVNTEGQILGHVPGVEVGDEFQYRVELALVGIHRLYQAGIDSVKLNGMLVANSVVSSGAYTDDMENSEVLIYSGQGGNVLTKSKEPEDQKLEKGNLALRNSISTQTPVRVIRGWKETKTVDPLDPKPKQVTTYVYDGLYTVKNYWTETGPHGKQVFMFELRRNPDQPELAWKQLKKSSKSIIRPGVCVKDISRGQEPFPISAVNTLDDQKTPPFNYISKMRYPSWFNKRPPPGCDCTGRCYDSKRCSCAVRNGGEVPYNRNGALVETKSLVYECGPNCKCPPSCYNRVSQRGIKFQFEIFKTESRGWGLRALNSILSGSFICEYAGEILEDKEAEKRVGSDEYLFDIGHNCHDSGEDVDSKLEGGFTIDAAEYGNLGRFINHCCLPNLYAQNVIYDHDDSKMPHIMFFALENIPPLQELTYDYNYSMGQIADTDGNIKVKKCLCGAAQCAGSLKHALNTSKNEKGFMKLMRIQSTLKSAMNHNQ